MFPMKLEVTITNASQLQDLAALFGETKANPASEKGKKAEKKTEATKTEPEGQKDVELGIIDEAAGGKTLDEAKALTMKVVAAKGRDAAVALLEKYGVKVAAKLAPEQVDSFCADAEAELNG